MTRRRHTRTINPFGTTEEYNARLERAQNPNYDTRYAAARHEATVHDDPFIQSVYKERDRLNALERNSDPWEVDHIRPLSRGGLHTFDNLRLMRASRNCDDPDRSEESIEFALRLVKYNRSKGYIS